MAGLLDPFGGLNMIGPGRDDEGPPAGTDDPIYHKLSPSILNELAKSHFPLPCWEGIKGRVKITPERR
jgi:hypothetical protein